MLCLFGLEVSNEARLREESYPKANDFLAFYKDNLQETYIKVLNGSRTREFFRFRGYNIIDYGIYKSSLKSSIKDIKMPLIFFRGYLRSNPVYSEYGGVSIEAMFFRDADDKKAKHTYLNFDGRYFSDLLEIGKNGEFYAFCALNLVNRCLLIGIGEKW